MDFLRNLLIGTVGVIFFLGLFLPYAFALERKGNDSFIDDQIREEVKKYLGVKYRRGGSSKRGVDCSGFVRLIYRNIFDVDLPYIAAYQYSLPIFKKVSLEKLRTGDLIFFSPNKKRINHVGIYLSGGRFAHALSKWGVIISNLENRYWKSRIYSTNRITTREVLDNHIRFGML